MAKLLYPRFLEDDVEYEAAETLWHQQWQSLLTGLEGVDSWESPWLGTQLADGTPCRDGNPIFSALHSSRKIGVRIIQLEPEDGPEEITWWTDKFAEGEEGEVRNLAICCVLSEVTMQKALQVIREWITTELVSIPAPVNNEMVNPKRELAEAS